MIPDSKRADFGGDSQDRLSPLPRDVVDCILELLPVEDAARTSILSTKWRYCWASLPNVVLDKLFCRKFARKSESVFSKTVDMILLQHLGDFVKFELDVSEARLSSYTDIDRWMLFVTRNGVKKLNLVMPSESRYKLPSYIFSCTTLTHLTIFDCVFGPPKSFLSFQNLRNLYLEKVIFVATSEFCVIKAPSLSHLTLKNCHGTQYVSIVSSQLVSLIVSCCPFLDLNCFTGCKKLAMLSLSDKGDFNKNYGERSTLEKLLSLPTLKVLRMSSAFLELLSVATVPKGLPFTLDLVRILSLTVDFGKLNQTSYALQLIKCSSNLTKLEIWDFSTVDNEAVSKYLNTPTFLDGPLKKLDHIVIRRFNGSKTLLLFIRLLFARAPSLVRMAIKQERTFGSTEERNITTELMRFPRASPKAELFYLQRVS